MDYEKYLEYQNRVEWLYDFHPDFFEELSPSDREALEQFFLYKVSDEEYPVSIKEFFESRVAKDESVQQGIIQALRSLYEISGSGDFE